MQRRAFRRGYSFGSRLTDVRAVQLEQKLAGQLSEQLAFLLQVISEGLTQHRREVVAEINDTFVEMRTVVSALRAERLGRQEPEEPIDVSAPPVSRRLQ